MLIKNKNSNDYTDTVRYVYYIISKKYGYTARISEIWELLRDSFGIKEFELLEPRLITNGSFESYLIDRVIDWQNGKEVNFTDIYKAILEVGDFTGTELLMFDSGNTEERLWGIFLSICTPGLEKL
mgnify:CR=1 FL=1